MMFIKILKLLFQRMRGIPQYSEQDYSEKAQPDNNKLDELKHVWDILSEKRICFYKSYLFEPRVDEQFRLEQMMKDLELEQHEIERVIYAMAPSHGEILRQEFHEKQQHLEQEFKTLEHDYARRKDQESTSHRLTETQIGERVRLKQAIEETEGVYHHIEEQLNGLKSELQYVEHPPINLQQRITKLEERRDLLNEKLHRLHQQLKSDDA